MNQVWLLSALLTGGLGVWMWRLTDGMRVHSVRSGLLWAVKAMLTLVLFVDAYIAGVTSVAPNGEGSPLQLLYADALLLPGMAILALFVCPAVITLAARIRSPRRRVVVFGSLSALGLVIGVVMYANDISSDASRRMLLLGWIGLGVVCGLGIPLPGVVARLSGPYSSSPVNGSD